MAAPSTITPVAPDGIELIDGYPTFIGFGEDTNLALWIHEGTPPGVEGGEPIPGGNMHTAAWETFFAQSTKKLEPFPLVVGYDPDAYNECIAIINKDDAATSSITFVFPDGSTLDFWGYMQSFKPQRMVKATHPLADVVIVPTNWDPVNRIEAGPVMTEVAGT